MASEQSLPGKPRVFFINNKSGDWVRKIIKQFMAECPNYAVDWVDKADPEKQTDSTTMNDLILQASVIFLCLNETYISDTATLDEEIKVSLSYNKRLIPIAVDGIDMRLIPTDIRKLPYINCPDGSKPKVLTEKIANLKEIMEVQDPSLNHATCHTSLLQRAIAWNEKGHLPREEKLDVQTFLNNCAMGIKPAATIDMLRFLLEEIPPSEQSGRMSVPSSIFISSAPDDVAFVSDLAKTLSKSERTVCFGFKDKSEEVIKKIAEHDCFLFIWTPHSVAESECIFALEQAALLLKKRIFIITCADTDETKVPEGSFGFDQMQRINIPSGGEGDSNYDSVLLHLQEQTDADSSHVKQHTRFLLLARAWMVKKSSSDLLSRREERQMTLWLQECMSGRGPFATSEHIEFLNVSLENLSGGFLTEEDKSVEYLSTSKTEALNIIWRFYPLTYCIPLGRQNLVKHDFLQISSTDGSSPEWQKRFMMVLPAGFFQTYTIRKNNKEIYSEVELHEELVGAKLEDVADLGSGVWQITFRSGKKILLNAASEGEKTLWMDVLSKLTELPSKVDPNSFLEGYVRMRSAEEDKLEQRYCVMGKASGKKFFKCYENSFQDSKPLQVMDIRFVKPSEHDAESFVLAGIGEQGLYSYLCKCPDEETANQWATITQEEDETERLMRVMLEFLECCKKIQPHPTKTNITECFNGETLLSWLLSSKKISTNTGASKLASELLQGTIITPVPGDGSGEEKEEGTVFYPSKWYTFGSVFDERNGPSVADLLNLDDAKEGTLKSGYMHFVEGSKYSDSGTKVFVMLRQNTDNLYFFYTKNSKTPHIVFRDCWVTLQIDVGLSSVSPDHGIITFNRQTTLRVTADDMKMWLRAFQVACFSMNVTEYKESLTTITVKKMATAEKNKSSINKAEKFLKLKKMLVAGNASHAASKHELQVLRTKILVSREGKNKSDWQNERARSYEELIMQGNRTRKEAFSDIVSTETLMLRELAHIIRNYLQPLASKMEDSQDDMARLLETAKDLYTVHTNFQADLIRLLGEAKDETDSMFLLSIIENIQRILVRQQFFTLNIQARENASKVKPQAKEKISQLLLLPSERVHHYVLLLERVQKYTPTTHQSYALFATFIPKIWNVAKKVHDCYRNTEQAAWSVYLNNRVTNIPDDWKILTPNRAFQAQGTFKYVFGMGKETDKPPVSHPCKDNRGESMRGLLFEGCFLLTTWKYKYRYRLDLNEVTARPKGQFVITIMSDMYNVMDLLKAETKDAHSNTVTSLVCDSQRERDEWLEKLEKATAVAKGSVSSSKSRKNASRDVSKVNLFLRVRPFVTDLEKQMDKVCLLIDDDKRKATLKQESLDASRADRVALYDRVFGVEDKQIDVFNTVGREVLGAVFAGYSVAIIAYGNTGAGKTHTMFGESQHPELKGLVPRILEELFEVFDKPGAYLKYSVEISYIQVYLDQIMDLLGHKGKGGNLPVVDIKVNKKGTHQLKKLKKQKITNVKQALKLLNSGNKKRATRSHAMNEVSSRSHAIFILTVRAQKSKDNRPFTSHAYLVDLAGSENTSITGVKGDGLREAKSVNKSLISLGRVVSALNENRRRTKGKRTGIPFRECKLTQILHEPLTNDFLCTLILNASCSPANSQASETGKTMVFGEAVKKLNNQATQVREQKLQTWLTGVWQSVSGSRRR